jgi:hypothetical protein
MDSSLGFIELLLDALVVMLQIILSAVIFAGKRCPTVAL